eukprot:776286-Alexandrium_andersonii.AAC.1
MDELWSQQGGVPIGGLVSRLAAMLLPGAADSRWRADGGPQTRRLGGRRDPPPTVGRRRALR